MARVVHFEILVDDPTGVSKFYEQVFGWQIATWGEGPRPTGWPPPGLMVHLESMAV